MFRIRTAILLSVAIVAGFVVVAHGMPAAVTSIEAAPYEVAP